MEPRPSHSVAVGYLLWIFGFTGAHRFYYGKPGTGTLWFFTAGLFGIGWLIDVFLIPRMWKKADIRFEKGAYDFTIAWLLHTFLGYLGAHRFYLGRWGTGLLYLCTAGLFGIGYYYDYLGLNRRVSERNKQFSQPWWQ